MFIHRNFPVTISRGCITAWLFRAESILWPAFVVATAAAIVSSQATISATYSIIKQAHAVGCFPRVKIIHTSKKYLGQIYSPDINWILMILCIAVTAGFKNQSQIANAYGTKL
jgi:KUP system potassium uptake protein